MAFVDTWLSLTHLLKALASRGVTEQGAHVVSLRGERRSDEPPHRISYDTPMVAECVRERKHPRASQPNDKHRRQYGAIGGGSLGLTAVSRTAPDRGGGGGRGELRSEAERLGCARRRCTRERRPAGARLALCGGGREKGSFAADQLAEDELLTRSREVLGEGNVGDGVCVGWGEGKGGVGRVGGVGGGGGLSRRGEGEAGRVGGGREAKLVWCSGVVNRSSHLARVRE